MGYPVKKSGEHLSPDSLLRNQQQLQKLWHQEWVIWGEALLFTESSVLLFTVPGKSSFDVPVQTEPFWV